LLTEDNISRKFALAIQETLLVRAK